MKLHAFAGSECVGRHAFGEEGWDDALLFDACSWHFEHIASKKKTGVDRKASCQALENID